MSAAWKRTVRAWAHRVVRRAWQRRGLLALSLYPLHLAHRLWRGLRALGERLRPRATPRLPVPVIVIGNLTVGGTGKTPLVIELVAALRARGWSPGVISRGFGGRSQHSSMVGAGSDPALCGDEPLLIHCVAGVPVAVGADRIAAAQLLLANHARCDVLIADDGLQHRRLGRDVEIALIDSRGLGNGWLLPAGPLRDPPERLKTVDAVVLHGTVPPVRIHSPFYRMWTGVDAITSLDHPTRRSTLAELAKEQQRSGLRLLAICAIGSPERYFAQLREQGLRFKARALPDHDTIDATMLPRERFDRVLMTAKDAVKCHRDASLASDPRLWVVPLQCRIDPGLVELLAARLRTWTDR
jgi:tetraacyldisaccharide 4'-kinase